jgi:hypothetical protein
MLPSRAPAQISFFCGTAWKQITALDVVNAGGGVRLIPADLCFVSIRYGSIARKYTTSLAKECRKLERESPDQVPWWPKQKVLCPNPLIENFDSSHVIHHVTKSITRQLKTNQKKYTSTKSMYRFVLWARDFTLTPVSHVKALVMP